MNQDAAQVKAMRAEVVAGLSADPPTLPPKFFYDTLGSKLFEAITVTPEYYPTACELEILRERGEELRAEVGPGTAVIELGTGSAHKVTLLLGQLQDVVAYVPVDISPAALEEAAVHVGRAFPGLRVQSVVDDFTSHALMLPELGPVSRRVVFYPGSTIGNLERDAATVFLSTIASWLHPGDALLIGFDLVKDPAVLDRAYNDAAGVTAAFNRNMLLHLNRAIGTDFDVHGFVHEAAFVPERARVEMHLRCLSPQTVTVGERTFRFEVGDRIHTESSHKFTREGFDAMADAAGFDRRDVWTDGRDWFAVGLYVRR